MIIKLKLKKIAGSINNVFAFFAFFLLSFLAVDFASAQVVSPVITPISPIVAEINTPISFFVSATNPNSGTLVYSLDAFSATGSTINPSTGEVNWTPTALGYDFIDIIVSDGLSPEVYYSVQILVISPSDFVAYPILPITAEINTLISFTAMATNPNNGTLVFSLDPSAPAGAAINPSTGEFTWTPAVSGSYFFDILVDDGVSVNPASVTVDISVTMPNIPGPVITPISPIVAEINTPISFFVSATNPNSGTLVYSLDAFSAAGSTINPSTGEVNWTPDALGYEYIGIIVSDGLSPDAFYTVQILVISPSDFVAYPILPITAEINTPISFTAMATNPNNGTLVYSLDLSAPAGADINPSTGEFTWTPTEAGYYFFNILVDDGISAVPASTQVDITVTMLNIPGPAISYISPITATVNTPVSFTVSATNPNNGTLVYSLDAFAPTGAVINPVTGEFSWTPSVSGFEVITIAVSDGIAPVSYLDVSITVNPIPDVVISPIPQIVSSVGTPISFLVTSTNPNNGTLVYSLGGTVPAGAAINPSTGEFTWTPALGGFYDIIINVSDGVMPSPVSTTVNFNISNPSGPFVIVTSVSPNGWISPYLPGVNTFNLGDSVTYTFSSLIDHYVVTDVIVDGVSMGATSSYSFLNINSNHTMDVIFGSESHTVNVTTLGNGTVSPSGTFTVVYPDVINFVFTPAVGSHVASVLINGVEYTTNNFTYSPVVADLDVIVTFAVTMPAYDIFSSAGPNGTISPLGTTTVLAFGSQTYAITPDPGYLISSLTVDGYPRTISSTYLFRNVINNHVISATFSALPVNFNIVSSAGIGGSISPLGTSTIVQGSDLIYNITPDLGYRVLDVSVDGVSVGAVTTYTFTNIVADHSISSTFELVPTLDTSAPVITLLGANPYEMTQGDVYTEPGFSAMDDTDGDISANVLITGAVDPATIGAYTLTYSVSDAAGNLATTSRAVNVNAPLPLCQTGADTDLSGAISNLEILQYIVSWKSGAVSNLLILKAILFWKAGVGC